jgi:hypothetical protein
MLLVGSIVILVQVTARWQWAARLHRSKLLDAARRAMDEVAGDLATDLATRMVLGRSGAHPATFRLTGESACIELAVPPTGIMLEVTSRDAAPRADDAGAVATGDRSFDAAFAVEGAPGDVVGCLLDADLRARLLACRPVSLAVRAARIEVRPLGAVAPDGVAGFLELAVRVADALPRAQERADAQLVRQLGAPYRPRVDSSQLRRVQARRAAELVQLAEVHRRRAAASRREMALAVATLVLVAVLLYASGG